MESIAKEAKVKKGKTSRPQGVLSSLVNAVHIAQHDDPTEIIFAAREFLISKNRSKELSARRKNYARRKEHIKARLSIPNFAIIPSSQPEKQSLETIF